ncbi:hypothetical protein TTHERM_01330020 (macronuclear) [Tetrahymena thermophila SB210]|uniref:Uncharacterized protein n=1 Tax=Tetrahymena thermophila (strain SB210) TaxID=312017 RepID=Q229W1_TETTS|nr:hypothetical protein TTHERM_01330020 [Tetrahymena thermophila SB210]EAR82077.2 hypothetical protein TTHERM_01330020 [Tetrahymena thermophila SB210]|eukprot:XP_001029740.2 hypothetical protein TTHERM_01330020 [Tetrahymena thermophila SB210]
MNKQIRFYVRKSTNVVRLGHTFKEEHKFDTPYVPIGFPLLKYKRQIYQL